MSCCACSENACRKTVGLFGIVFAVVIGGFILASLPELKRYIKISSM
jgi:hypothetical protein